jgi:hypothetical protein
MPDAIDRALAIATILATARFLPICVRGTFDSFVFPEFALNGANLTAESIRTLLPLIRRIGCQVMFQEIKSDKQENKVVPRRIGRSPTKIPKEYSREQAKGKDARKRAGK